MPPLIIAVVAAAATYAATAGAAILLGVAATSFAAVTIGAIAGAVVAYAGNALIASISGKPKAKQDASSAAVDAKRTIRSEVAPRRIVYGRARVSGPLIYAGSFGSNLEYLLLVVPLADHQVEAIDAVWLGEHKVLDAEISAGGGGYSFGDVTTGRFGSGPTTTVPARVSIRRLYGNQTQADPQLVAECPDGWTSADKLTGIAHLVVRLKFDPDLFQFGVPTISAEVRGRRVWDPRTNTTAYSDNWALVILDYLLSEHGLAASLDEIDLASFIAAANLSDENVQITAAGATQKRYRLNGTFTLDRQPIEVLEEMLAAGGGALVYVAGQYRLYGGAYEAPAITLTTEDFASDVEVVTKPPRRELFNSVRGNYIDPNAFWQAYPMPPLEWAPFIAEDGEQIWRELELPWVLDPDRALRIAKQLLLRSRQGVTIRANVKYASLDLSVWQTVAVTLADLGWSAKPFRIMGWAFSPESGLITLTMQEEQIASYAWTWDEGASAPEFPDTTLIDPLSIPAPTNLVVTPTTVLQPDGSLMPALNVSWTGSAHPFVVAHEVQWRAAGGEWSSIDVPLQATATQFFQITGIVAGVVYDVRVRGRSGLVRGPWAESNSNNAAPDTTAPAVPTGLTATGVIRGIALTWVNPTDVDLKWVEVWEATTAGGTYAKVGATGGTAFLRSNLLPGASLWFKLRAVDASGNASAYTAAVQGTASLLLANDIQDGILNTAKFAASIRPVAVPATNGELATLRTTDQIIYPQVTLTDSTTGQSLTALRLYRWSGTAWVDVVSAGQLSGTITSTQITDGAISTPKLAANAITADKVAANAITAGKIAAGAISSSQIAAGEIKAVNLASETLITQAGQLGTAVITTAKIGNLQVDTLRLANNAVTSVAIGEWVGSSASTSVNVVNGDGSFAASYVVQGYVEGNSGFNTVSSGEGDVTTPSPLAIGIYRNFSLVSSYTVVGSGAAIVSGAFPIVRTDNLSAGSYTWSIAASGEPSGTTPVNIRRIVLVVTKILK